MHYDRIHRVQHRVQHYHIIMHYDAILLYHQYCCFCGVTMKSKTLVITRCESPNSWVIHCLRNLHGSQKLKKIVVFQDLFFWPFPFMYACMPNAPPVLPAWLCMYAFVHRISACMSRHSCVIDMPIFCVDCVLSSSTASTVLRCVWYGCCGSCCIPSSWLGRAFHAFCLLYACVYACHLKRSTSRCVLGCVLSWFILIP